MEFDRQKLKHDDSGLVWSLSRAVEFVSRRDCSTGIAPDEAKAHGIYFENLSRRQRAPRCLGMAAIPLVNSAASRSRPLMDIGYNSPWWFWADSSAILLLVSSSTRTRVFRYRIDAQHVNQHSLRQRIQTGLCKASIMSSYFAQYRLHLPNLIVQPNSSLWMFN